VPGETFMCDCILFSCVFQIGRQIPAGRHIAAWSVQICTTCLEGTCDGIIPDKHPKLMDYLRARKIPITLNQRGWINVPPR
jgi:hypothetical protein